MELKDQSLAFLGLLVITVVAGFLFFAQSSGQVAGVNVDQESNLEKANNSVDLVSDKGQEVIDKAFGLEMKVRQEVQEKIKKRAAKK